MTDAAVKPSMGRPADRLRLPDIVRRFLVKQAIFPGDRSVAFTEMKMPRAVDDWAVIKVIVAPLCTEYKGCYDGQPTDRIGHEAAGEVVEAGSRATVSPGDRVVMMPSLACGKCGLCESGFYMHCENGHDYDTVQGSAAGGGTVTQYLARPSFLLLPAPDDMPLERAALAGCALGPTFGAMQKLNVTAFDTVLITGLGPVGLGGVVNGRFRGARVIAAEPAPWRAERARAMGAALVLDPTEGDPAAAIREFTGGHGVDYAIDCSGNVHGQRLCIDATRRLGGVAFVGECQDTLEITVSRDMLRKGLTLVGNWHFNRHEYARILRVIERSDLLDLLISHTFPMSEIERAFEIQQAAESAKILLRPWD